MKHLKLLTVVLSGSLLLFTGCKKDISNDVSAEQQTVLSEKNTAKLTPELLAEKKEKLEQMMAALPAGHEQRLQHNANQWLTRHPEYRNMVMRALKATAPAACDDNTPVSQWLSNELADWNSTVITYALLTGMLDFPTYDALFFGNSTENQYYGVNGEYSHAVTKGFKDLRRFWNIESSDIVLGAMHGSMLGDRERVIRTDMLLYGDTRADAEYWADLILLLLDVFPQYRNGDHPIFTFNAFAFSKTNIPPIGVIPSKIIMGDGIMDGFNAIGFNDVAPQAILAHEYGHHIQYQLNLFTSPRTPEGTRRTELMADAYAAYYLSHAKGASMQWKRVKQFLQVFFNIGDCNFNDTNHHGTPTQRLAAAEWGYSIANDAHKQGHILSAQEFTQLFEAQLPIFVNQ